MFLLHLLNTEPVLPFQTTTDAPLLLRPRGPGDVQQPNYAQLILLTYYSLAPKKMSNERRAWMPILLRQT